MDGKRQTPRSATIPAAPDTHAPSTFRTTWRNEDQRIELDLGIVAEMARVRINGQDLGVLWNTPFRRDISSALRPGDNRIEIIVTNYWRNRLIGDEQPDATRFTFSSLRPYSADSTLRPSGLLGPVRLLGVTAAD